MEKIIEFFTKNLGALIAAILVLMLGVISFQASYITSFLLFVVAIYLRSKFDDKFNILSVILGILAAQAWCILWDII